MSLKPRKRLCTLGGWGLGHRRRFELLPWADGVMVRTKLALDMQELMARKFIARPWGLGRQGLGFEQIRDVGFCC